MLLSPRPRSTAADLLRLAAAWLAAIVLVQGLAVAQALGAGPWHRHRDVAAAALPHHHHHHHHHDEAAAHVHDAGDPSVQRLGVDADTLDAAALALAAAMALMLLGALALPGDTRRHHWHAAAACFWRSALAGGLLRPPQAG